MRYLGGDRTVIITLLKMTSLASVVGLLAFYVFIGRIDQLRISMASQAPVVIQMLPGSHFQSLIAQLEALGLARQSHAWRMYGRLTRPFIQAGEYRWEPGETLETLLDRMAAGETVKHRFTVIEGWTLSELRTALKRDPRLSDQTSTLEPEVLMERVRCQLCVGEGAFLPETYLIERGVSDLQLLQRAHQALVEVVGEVWASRASGLPLETPGDLLVLASLIEKETAAETEREKIAGVFIRRLQLGMRLQTDPSVIYGLGADYNGSLTRKDLRTDHPWNTYTRHGLPKTPIALPGLASLVAAAKPADTEYLYFVAKGDGTHAFSRTLDEHNRAVNRYIRGKRDD